MKMKRKGLLFIVLLIVLTFASTAFADYTKIADNTVPAYTNSALTKRNGNERVDKGDRVTVHQETPNAYYVTYPVRNGTKTRWVPKNIFNNVPAPVQEQDGYIKTNGARLNFRTTPNGTIIDKINNGTTVKVLAHNNPSGWSKIRYNNREGYVSSQYVVIGNLPTPAPAPTPTPPEKIVYPAEGDYYLIHEANGGFALDVKGGGQAAPLTNVWLYNKNNSDAQLFTVKRNSNGWYTIAHKRTGHVLNVPYSNTSNGIALWIARFDNTDACFWRFIDAGNGSYFIQNKISPNPIMEVSGNNIYTGAKVQLWQRHNGQAGKWKLVKVTAPAPVQEQDGYININGARLNFRATPNGTIIDKINNGTAVKVLAHNNPNGWSKIRYNGREGYASSQYVVIGKIPVPTPVTTQFRYPLNNIYVCGNNWMTKYSKRPSRPYHAGIDVKSSSGDKTVYATADGTVAASGWNSANGNFVIIQHVLNGKTIYSFYCHMSKRSVNKGNSVKSGTPIGIIGNTGSASAGEHLHFSFVDKLMSSGGYWGYVTTTGNAVTYQGYTFYSPAFVIDNQRLP
ncbi:RICIN domain-containing protein [Anaerovibrio sp.]|uniref:RICIN domain-containing protein n=1 Tax=Anaerovibrio sp. TaxID=1872532 RepID=UPI0025B91654|nr:RICIN domain-containing protein [Anaerovibrio sp.]MBR2142288.1 SH3 domain-containing protein [Anaerovibrio sp.]